MFEGEYALREPKSYGGGVIDAYRETFGNESYPLSIMIRHENVCIRPSYPTEVIEVLQ